jgi:putative glycoprotease GCP
MNILAIESSCDETSAAVVSDGRKILSNIVATQIDMHALYGGVVPEIASRAHTEAIVSVTKQALQQSALSLDEIDAVAVTNEPGLIGALLVGVNFAKSFAYSANLPLIPVHHIKGHIAANYLQFNGQDSPLLEPPFSALVVSGGHTSLINVESYTRFHIIGATRDDAAGECFDKVARIMGLPYPGGAKMDQNAALGNQNAFPFPEAKVKDYPYDFSFSGLKTSAVNLIHGFEQRRELFSVPDVAASFTKAVVNTVSSRVEKLFSDRQLFCSEQFVLAGGVAANSHLRKALSDLCKKHHVSFYCPPISLCGDNAAMIASQGFYEFCDKNKTSSFDKKHLELNAYATKAIEV